MRLGLRCCDAESSLIRLVFDDGASAPDVVQGFGSVTDRDSGFAAGTKCVACRGGTSGPR